MSSYFRNTEGHVYNSHDGKPWQPTNTPVTKKDGETAQREQAKDELRKLLKPGTTVYTILNHCSTSGMSRSISLSIGQKDGSIRKLDYLVATAKGVHIDEKHGGAQGGGVVVWIWVSTLSITLVACCGPTVLKSRTVRVMACPIKTADMH